MFEVTLYDLTTDISQVERPLIGGPQMPVAKLRPHARSSAMLGVSRALSGERRALGPAPGL
jgi:hypothetical protein